MNTIKARREEQGLTQTYLAEKLGIDKSAVSKWENGVANPRADKLRELAGLLGGTVDELLCEREVSRWERRSSNIPMTR